VNPAWAAALVWAVLSWRGGLDYVELCMAAALLAGLLWRGRAALPGFRELGGTERLLWLLVFYALAGTLVSVRPQETFDAAAVLGLALLAATYLRRAAPGLKDGLPDFLLAASGLYAAAFAGTGLLLIPWWTGGGAGDAIPLAKAFFPNQNLLAGGLAVPALLLGLARVGDPRRGGLRDWVAGGALLAGLSCVVYAGSRGAYLALGLGLAWLIARWGPGRRRLAWTSAILLALLAVLTVRAPFSRLMARIRIDASPALASPMVGRADPNSGRRVDFYKGALRLSAQRPWTGFGLGTFAASAYALDLPTALTLREPIARYRLSLEHAHNDWLELAVDVGWPATLALAACAVAWLLRRWRSGRCAPGILGLEAVVVAAGATSMVDMNLRTPVLAWGILLCFAAIEARDPGPPPAGAGKGASSVLVLGILVLALESLLGGACAQHFRDLNRAAHGQGQGDIADARTALWLQPLDAGLAATVQESGAWVPPWSAWAGREQPAWWWHAASRAAAAGDRALQERDARQAIALRPYFAPGYYWLGSQLDQWGRRGEAAALMDQALALEPNFSRVLAWQADRAAEAGNKALARALVRKVRAIQTLRMADGRYDDYTLYIQKADAAWLLRQT
jgi:O-antigen ligase